MAVDIANAVINMKIDPEIQKAREAIGLPEVQEIMRKLSKYNLGVCIPHMHGAETDFEALPDDTVQIEEDCRVRWVRRSALNAMPGSVPVAWRWRSNGIQSAAECMQICSPAKKGHKRSHL